MLGGDFNLGDIHWDSESAVDPQSSQTSGSDKLIQLLRDHQLKQMQRNPSYPTREDRVLNLFCTIELS